MDVNVLVTIAVDVKLLVAGVTVVAGVLVTTQ